MSAKKTSSKAKVEEAAAEAVTEPVEEAEKPASKVKAAKAEKAEPVAYIGPDIKFIAKRGTIYSNGLPAKLEEKIEELPAISGLIVPVSNLSTAMQAVVKEGTSLNSLYIAVAEKTK